MFVVNDRRFGVEYFVFTQMDPRADGYLGNVIENAELDYDMNDIHRWPAGADRPEPQLGRDPANPNRYKVFKYPSELAAEGFDLVSPTEPFVAYSWASYRRLFPRLSDVAETIEPEEWSTILDEVDDATAKVRRRSEAPVPPPGSNRDAIAEWVAKRHLGADGSIRQVVYLPTGAPPNEIRLLEVSERVTSTDDRLEPLDFGIEVAGQAMKILVADVTKAQLDQLKADPTSLPRGWGWGNERSWGTGA